MASVFGGHFLASDIAFKKFQEVWFVANTLQKHRCGAAKDGGRLLPGDHFRQLDIHRSGQSGLCDAEAFADGFGATGRERHAPPYHRQTLERKAPPVMGGGAIQPGRDSGSPCKGSQGYPIHHPATTPPRSHAGKAPESCGAPYRPLPHIRQSYLTGPR